MRLLAKLLDRLFGPKPPPIPPVQVDPWPDGPVVPVPNPPATPNPPIEVARLVNRERQARGLAPLVVAERLTLAAGDHAADMERRNYFSHTAPPPAPRTSQDRANSRGFAGNVREVIARGFASPESVTAGWLRSSGHAAALLHRNAVSIGVGRAGDRWCGLVGFPAGYYGVSTATAPGHVDSLPAEVPGLDA